MMKTVERMEENKSEKSFQFIMNPLIYLSDETKAGFFAIMFSMGWLPGLIKEDKNKVNQPN